MIDYSFTLYQTPENTIYWMIGRKLIIQKYNFRFNKNHIFFINLFDERNSVPQETKIVILRSTKKSYSWDYRNVNCHFVPLELS